MPALAAATAGGLQNNLPGNPEVLLDWGDTNCYSGSGTTFTNQGSGGSTYNGTLVNGPTYSSSFGGIITTDGVDDMISLNNNFSVPRAGGTFMIWCRTHQDASVPVTSYTAGAYNGFVNFSGTSGINRAEGASNCNDFFPGGGANTFGSYTNQWYCMIGVLNNNLATWFERGINNEQRTGGYGSENCATAVSQIVADFIVRHFGENTTYEGHFDGDYGVIALWDQALTNHQCLQAFGAYRHRYGV